MLKCAFCSNPKNMYVCFCIFEVPIKCLVSTDHIHDTEYHCYFASGTNILN